MTEIYPRQSVLYQYIVWRFFDVPKNIIGAWQNYLAFNLNYFSIPLLFKTLFSYWHRYHMGYGRGFDLKRYFEAFTFNIISRVLGAVTRLFLIAIGIVVEIFIFFAGIIIFLLWLFLPVIWVVGVIFAMNLLF